MILDKSYAITGRKWKTYRKNITKGDIYLKENCELTDNNHKHLAENAVLIELKTTSDVNPKYKIVDTVWRSCNLGSQKNQNPLVQ